MINVNLKVLKEGKTFQKNNLYRINDKQSVWFEEDHETHKEVVELLFDLEKSQYGIYANEFRGSNASKEGGKSGGCISLCR